MLFREALSLAAEERGAFLERACAGRPELRAAVEALLEAHEKSATVPDRPLSQTFVSGTGQARADCPFDDAPVPDDASAGVTETSDYQPTSRSDIVVAGRYTLRQKIGEGGMGEVWVARQTEPVTRKVALKLIKTGMDSKAVVARFEQERQALAILDHPNIAKVLDGGLTPGGQPFFVMELVNGLPLGRFCDEARLTPRERLELFVPICRAVQHAHQKGIVHRDLKPANILVTIIDGKPVPKVIDFGVAKATAGKLTELSMSTHFGAVIGTFEYMSPEQAGFSGVDIDTRADIYALGVILYELLTGLRPFDSGRLRDAVLTEVLRIIKEEEPSKPSTRLSTDDSLPSMAALRQIEPRKLTALLRGELDWVVMKCLEKHRERRYETANALARDIQRYLADEAVEARPASTGYRLRKFLHRNKGPVLAANVVMLALIGGVVGTTIGMIHANRARADEAKQRGIAQRNEANALLAAEAERQAKEREGQQRAKAEKARDRTRQALDAMTSSVTGDSLTTQREISALQKKFLTEVLTYYREFAGEKADDEASRVRTALAAARVGMIEYRLGRTVEAAAANRLALDGFATLVAEFPGVPLYRQNLAIHHNNLGLLLAGLGKGPEAEEHYRQALAICEKLAAEFPAVGEYRGNLASSHTNMGRLLAGLGKRLEAEEQFRKALAISEKLVAGLPALRGSRADLANCHNNLGSLLRDLRKYPEAHEQYRSAHAIREKLAAELAAEPDYRKDLAQSLHNLGAVLRDLGRLPEAEEQFQHALAILEKLNAEFPAVPEYRRGLELSHTKLGGLLAGMGRRSEAAAQYRKAVAIQEKLVAEFPAVPGYRVDLGGNYCDLGRLVMNGGGPGESLDWFEKAIRTLTAVYERDRRIAVARQFLRNSHANRAMAYDRLRKFAEAAKAWGDAIELSPAKERAGPRAARATSRVRAGQVDEALAEVAELTKAANWSSGQWYDFACVYAIASGKSTDKKRAYADRAMDLLRKAVRAGWSDAAHMAKDTDLDAIRGREDFKRLVEDLAKKPLREPGPKP